MQSIYSKMVTLNGEDVEVKREEIRAYFHKVYERYEKLFDMLKYEEAFYKQPESTRHPLIFYFAHTATFYVNKLISANIISKRVDENFESMFAVGVDEMEWDDLEQSHYNWPSVDAIRAYRKKVYALVNGLISELDLTLPIKFEDPFWIILMGIEHENIHLETSSVLIRELPIDDVQEVDDFVIFNVVKTDAINELVQISEGEITLGKEYDHHLYGWDNEYGTEHHKVEAFKVSKYLVSNREFAEFVEAGGYDNKKYWDNEGKEYLQSSGAKFPRFWIQNEDGTFSYRSVNKIIKKLPRHWPVVVNALEAEAFCRYKSEVEGKNIHLPSEAQWHLIRERCNIGDVPDFNDKHANINLRHASSACRIDRFSFYNSVDDVEIFDVVGNVWQWSSTATHPFEGFRVHPAYDDFSLPTFDKKHSLMLGGSFISCGNEMSKHARYAFRKHFHQHSGFRYVADENIEHENIENIYESDALVAQYCEFQYGESKFGVKNFAVECANIASSFVKDEEKIHALDLGCATGRASFELARKFEKVTGIDFSTRFIGVATQMQKDGKITYERVEEGAFTTRQERKLEDFALDNVVRRVEFFQGDACNLKAHFESYNLIMATNLIDRLYDPKLFLNDMAHRVAKNGLLVLTSPYTWLEEYTAKENWIGGVEGKKSIDGLKEVLESSFELVHTQDVEFVIRETARKYQHSIAELSVWRKI